MTVIVAEKARRCDGRRADQLVPVDHALALAGGQGEGRALGVGRRDVGGRGAATALPGSSADEKATIELAGGAHIETSLAGENTRSIARSIGRGRTRTTSAGADVGARRRGSSRRVMANDARLERVSDTGERAGRSSEKHGGDEVAGLDGSLSGVVVPHMGFRAQWRCSAVPASESELGI